MTRSFLATLLLLLLLAAPAQLGAQPDPSTRAESRVFTAELLATMDRMTDASISPDGRWVAYVVRTVAPDREKVSTHIMLADLDRPQAAHRPLPATPAKQDSPTWSADGRTLYFRGPDAQGVSQLWRMSIEGATPVQLSRAPIDLGSFKIAPDGRFAVASFRVYPDCATLACTEQRAAEPKVGTLYKDMTVRFYDSFGDGRYNNLFKLTFEDGQEPLPLMRGFISDVPARPLGTANSFAISPDGTTLVFSGRRSGVSPVLSAIYRLFEVSLTVPSAPKEIGADLPDSHSNPIFSPNGKLLAYLDTGGSGSDGDTSHVRVRDLATRQVRELGATLDRSPNEIIWSADGKTIFARSDDNGRERLFAYRLNGSVERVRGGDGVSAVSASKRGLAVTVSSFRSPAQVFVTDASGRPRRQVTHVAAAQLTGIEMARSHSVVFKGWNDDPVQTWVIEPLKPVPGRGYPVIFLIHGGPHGVYQDEWGYGRNPQVWAARGYATVMVNFHGSTGFGEKFAHAVLGHRGDRVPEDLRKGWDAILARFPVLDGNRACAMGSSFGGYMVNLIAGIWNEPWRCLVSHAGTFDSRSSYSSDIQWHNDRQIGGTTPWESPEAVEKFNPARFVAKWKKPILITHGGRDFRVPFDQGLSAFTAAQRRGVPSEMLYLPNENHIVSGPKATMLWYEVVDAWLDRWTAQE